MVSRTYGVPGRGVTITQKPLNSNPRYAQSYGSLLAQHDKAVAAGTAQRRPDAEILAQGWGGHATGGLTTGGKVSPYTSALSGNTVTPQPVGNATTFQGTQPGTQQPATNGMGATGGQQYSQQPGQIPAGGSTTGAATSYPVGQQFGNLQSNNPTMAQQGTPVAPGVTNLGTQQGGFIYSGNMDGRAIFRDPTTGERFNMPGEAGVNLQVGQGYQLPSATPRTGLIGAEEAIQQGVGNAMSAVQSGQAQGRADLMQAGQGANSTLNRYYDPGYKANDYQAALSGALGNDAQAQAMESFQGSPGQQYLLNESERAIRRNAAATGGLGGANVQRALQENAIGLAAQDFDNAFNRLGSVSDRGMNAAGQISGNTMSTGQALSGLGQNAANLSANMLYGAGENLAAGRTRAGENIASNIEGTQSNLANLLNSSGQQISGAIDQGASNLSQLLAGAGRDNLSAQQAYATILANLATGAGSQVQGLPGLGGTSQTDGNIDDIGKLIAGIGAFSDRRLKANIVKIGQLAGQALYRWTWKPWALPLVGDQPSIGFMADEVPAQFVERHASGFYRVNYRGLLNGMA